MAKSSEQLFSVFAARVAELLRERFGMEPGPLLRVRQEHFTIEGLVRKSQHGDQEWHHFQAMPEQLEWDGPEAMAQVFVRDYAAALEAARR